MFVRGEILLSSAPVLTVPVDSVVSRGGESFVFTLDGNRAVSTPVKTGAESDKYVEISSGLKAGQLVVEKGARFLSDRDVVDLAK
jgi:multidrug efflux pump subunit AcrA (membrane-fusion protein)